VPAAQRSPDPPQDRLVGDDHHPDAIGVAVTGLEPIQLR
jgi:hypothetical protein